MFGGVVALSARVDAVCGHLSSVFLSCQRRPFDTPQATGVVFTSGDRWLDAALFKARFFLFYRIRPTQRAVMPAPYHPGHR